MSEPITIFQGFCIVDDRDTLEVAHDSVSTQSFVVKTRSHEHGEALESIIGLSRPAIWDLYEALGRYLRETDAAGDDVDDEEDEAP